MQRTSGLLIVKSVEQESLFQLFKDLLDHGDQTLRGQAAMFISEVISEYSQLSASSSLIQQPVGLDLEAYVNTEWILTFKDGYRRAYSDREVALLCTSRQ